MSLNRENVAWQNPSGKWYIGFWDFYRTGDDYEWDVEYYDDHFWFFSGPHASYEAAYDSYTRCHANPGGGHVVPYSEQDAEYIARLNEVAARYLAEVGARV